MLSACFLYVLQAPNGKDSHKTDFYKDGLFLKMSPLFGNKIQMKTDVPDDIYL